MRRRSRNKARWLGQNRSFKQTKAKGKYKKVKVARSVVVLDAAGDLGVVLEAAGEFGVALDAAGGVPVVLALVGGLGVVFGVLVSRSTWR